jgi:hypothetical protein
MNKAEERFSQAMVVARDVATRAPHAAEFVVEWSAHSPDPRGVILTGKTSVDLGWSFVASRHTEDGRDHFMCVVTRQANIVNLPLDVAEVVYGIADQWFRSKVEG